VVEGLGNGRYLITGIGDPGCGSRRVAYAVRDRGRMWVFIDGRTYVIEPDAGHAGERAHVANDPLALSAPMPATVIAVNVAPGQNVAAGDLLVLLEAMKMEVPIKAPRAGRVKSLACREGELVQPGVPLVEFE
jgi:3-methylcrotonyl-CoA carboxylase alpha subunit